MCEADRNHDITTDAAAEHNRKAWDSFRRQRDAGLVPIRNDSAADILDGRPRLDDAMLALAGDVAGKRMLDLGCGDAAEMLAWAVLGAEVGGVDNSPTQLEAGQRNIETLREAGKLTTSCSLVLSGILQLPSNLLSGQFDIVYSGWLTCWIGDLDLWFGDVYRALKDDGLFLLEAGHALLDKENPYFAAGPRINRQTKPSSWNPLGESFTTVEWTHTLGDIVTSVAQSGLRITHLTEFPDDDLALPASYALRAVKGSVSLSV
jgi:ubiquinone/menaquinone biosynthesis C-methylase UbiE